MTEGFWAGQCLKIKKKKKKKGVSCSVMSDSL